MFLGLVLIFIGSLFLLRNLGLLPVEIWPIFWPSLLIFSGIYLVYLFRKARASWENLWVRLRKKLE